MKRTVAAVIVLFLISISALFLTVEANPVDEGDSRMNSYLLGNLVTAIFVVAVVLALGYITYRLVKKWSSA